MVQSSRAIARRQALHKCHRYFFSSLLWPQACVYSQKGLLDIWAIGCIFAELATIWPLFQGTEIEVNNPNAYQDNQVKQIVSVLGNVSTEDWPGVQYLPFYTKAYYAGAQHCLAKRVEKLQSAQGLDLLTQMLAYDPNKRITAADALEHPYFKEAPIPVKNVFSRDVGYASRAKYPIRKEFHPQATAQKAKRKDASQPQSTRLKYARGKDGNRF